MATDKIFIFNENVELDGKLQHFCISRTIVKYKKRKLQKFLRLGLFHWQVVSPSKARKKYNVSLVVYNGRPIKLQLKQHGYGNSNMTNIRR